jgi:predicted TIM-barrel fold metal-dependent hydrolase
MFIRETIKAIDALDISDENRQKIYFRNALRIMRMKEHEH